MKKSYIFLFTALLMSGVFIYLLNNGNSNEPTKKPKSSLYKEVFGESTIHNSSAINSEGGVVNIRVNNFTGVSEPKIAISPVDFNKVVAVSNDFTLMGNNGRVFFSQDGGLNWTASTIPLSGKTNFDDATDPVLTYDAEGNLYYAVVHYQIIGNGDGIFVNKSVDNGLTWNQTATEVKSNNNALVFEDRPAITADLSSTSTRNNIYVVWTSLGNNINKILFSKSVDGGNTFGQPLTISEGTVHTADVKVDMNGTVYVSYLKNNSIIEVVKSNDAGNSFSSSVVAAQFQHSGVQTEKAFLLKQINSTTGVRVKSYPSLAIDNQTGKIYLAFSGKNGNDLSDIFLVSSEDGGLNWSEKVRVNNDNTLTDQFFPEIAVDNNSNVHMIWQDSREDSENVLTSTYYAKSVDGVNFVNTKISNGNFNPHNILLGNYIGDYNGLAIQGDVVMPIWTDGRNNNFDLFTSIIPNGTTNLNENNMPVNFEVSQNYPNPFNPSTLIKYSIPTEGRVVVKLYNILGKEIVTLLDSEQSAGTHSLLFDSKNIKGSLSSGTYFYSVTFGNETVTKKMLLTK